MIFKLVFFFAVVDPVLLWFIHGSRLGNNFHDIHKKVIYLV